MSFVRGASSVYHQQASVSTIIRHLTMLFLLFICLIALRSVSSLEILDLSFVGLPNRLFPNVSLGLRYQSDDKCKWDKPEMTYTPNRRVQKDTVEDADLDRLQLAVVLVVGGHSGDKIYDYGPAGSINGLMAVWDSWLENFFSYTSNTTSLVLLFDERDFKKQNYTKSTHTYLDNILIHNMGAEPADCVHLRHKQGASLEAIYSHQGHVRTAPHVPQHSLHSTKSGLKEAPKTHRAGCSNELHLDQGYRVYYIDVAGAHTHPNQKPLVIFAAVHKFPLAEWVKPEEEEKLFKEWKPWRLPGRFPTNYAYVKMTNWYSYHMLNLKILDFFDYGGKLDNDVSFVAPFPEPNLPRRLARQDTKMMVTQNGWYYDDPRVAQGVRQCLDGWVADQNKYCKGPNNPNGGKLVAGGRNDPTFWESNLNATFRAHFLVFWLGLYTAPETYSLAKYWNDWHPRGMWDYRWGDQQWWPRPISMFGEGNIAKEIDHYDLINTDNGKYVVHKLWPRQGTVTKGRYFNAEGSTRKDRDLVYNITSKPFIY